MNRREFVIRTTGAAAAVAIPFVARGYAQSPRVELSVLAEGKGLNATKRTISRLVDGDRLGVRLSEAEGEGPAFLPGVDFANGTLELELKGRDVQGGSFLGVAFHGEDGDTYDAIYFRPFNFKTDDPARVLRAVQYVSHPAYPWQRLRAEQPGRYEKPVKPVPDPNAWFQARIVVASPQVSVYVAGSAEPCLTVTQLSQRRKGLVGVWVGNTSGGEFANMAIRPA